MRLKKRGRGTAVFMAAAMAVCSLSGCGGSDEKTESGNKQAEVADSTAVSQFQGGMWSDSWTVAADGAGEVEVNLNALIVLPEADNMSEVKVKEVSNDEATKKLIAEGIFGDKVYAYDTEKLPRDVLKKYRSVSEQSLAYFENMKSVQSKASGTQNMDEEEISQRIEQLQNEIKQFDKQLKSAPEDYVVSSAGNFSKDNYWGKLGKLEYILDFYSQPATEDISKSSIISLSLRDEAKVCPKELKNSESVTHSGVTLNENADNACKLTQAEAQKKADEFMEKTGFSDMICSSVQALEWSEEQTQDSQKKKSVLDGYFFAYEPGVGKLAFSSFGTEYTDYANITQQKPAFSLMPSVYLSVTDEGVISASWGNMVATTSVKEKVELLPFDKIKEVVKSKMTEYIKSNGKELGNSITMNRMELVYFRVKDESGEGQYTYVPAWRLKGYGDFIFLVNAMDGSMIDAQAELM